MRLLLVALLCAISYAQTEFKNLDGTYQGRFACQQVSYPDSCATALASRVSNMNNGPCVTYVRECTGQRWVNAAATEAQSYASACPDGVEVKFFGTRELCDPTRAPTATPTETVPNFGLEDEKGEGFTVYWVLVCLLIIVFCLQIIFFAWCCYTDAQNKRAKPDTYSVELPSAPKEDAPIHQAPVIITSHEGTEVQSEKISLEKVESQSVGGNELGIAKQASPSNSTYEVADGSLPNSFYDASAFKAGPGSAANSEKYLGDKL